MGGLPPRGRPECQVDVFRLLMERQNLASSEHVIDIQTSLEASVSASHESTPGGLEPSSHEDRRLNGARTQVSQTSLSASSGSNSQNSSLVRRGEARRHRNPLNSALWISVELVLTVSQIVVSIIVLMVSRHERPHAPLRAWIIGYASGCVLTLPFLYWRYRNSNQVVEQDLAQSHQGSTHISVPAGAYSVSVSRASEGDDHVTPGSAPSLGQNAGRLTARVKVLVEYFKIGLDCLFAVWFVVGNVWIFGSHSSASDAPNLYRLCIVFLTFSCIGYAMPFILCAIICCCLPCIVSILGFREDLTHTRGATSESIDALPTYKFKSQRNRNGNDRDSNTGAGYGGIVAAGTEKEHIISGEDAVCCICLAKYVNNDELKELPCLHFFHKECVDKWLKINASCPLCKTLVGERVVGSLSVSNSAQ